MITIIIEQSPKQLTKREKTIGILKDRYLAKIAKDFKRFEMKGMDKKVIEPDDVE